MCVWNIPTTWQAQNTTSPTEPLHTQICQQANGTDSAIKTIWEGYSMLLVITFYLDSRTPQNESIKTCRHTYGTFLGKTWVNWMQKQIMGFNKSAMKAPLCVCQAVHLVCMQPQHRQWHCKQDLANTKHILFIQNVKQRNIYKPGFGLTNETDNIVSLSPSKYATSLLKTTDIKQIVIIMYVNIPSKSCRLGPNGTLALIG